MFLGVKFVEHVWMVIPKAPLSQVGLITRGRCFVVPRKGVDVAAARRRGCEGQATKGDAQTKGAGRLLSEKHFLSIAH